MLKQTNKNLPTKPTPPLTNLSQTQPQPNRKTPNKSTPPNKQSNPNQDAELPLTLWYITNLLASDFPHWPQLLFCHLTPQSLVLPLEFWFLALAALLPCHKATSASLLHCRAFLATSADSWTRARSCWGWDTAGVSAAGSRQAFRSGEEVRTECFAASSPALCSARIVLAALGCRSLGSLALAALPKGAALPLLPLVTAGENSFAGLNPSYSDKLLFLPLHLCFPTSLISF